MGKLGKLIGLCEFTRFETPTTDHFLKWNGSKITFSAVSAGLSFSGDTANGVCTYGGAGTVDVESSLTYNGNVLAHNGDLSISGTNLTMVGPTKIAARKFDLPADGAGKVNGDIIYMGSGGTAAGKIHYFTHADDAVNGSWVQTNSNDPGTATGLIAVALGSDPDVNGMLLRGTVDLNDAIVGTEVMGSIIYLDKATAGAATTAAPTATGDIVRVIGYALSTGDTNKIWFNPDNTWVEHV